MICCCIAGSAWQAIHYTIIPTLIQQHWHNLQLHPDDGVVRGVIRYAPRVYCTFSARVLSPWKLQSFTCLGPKRQFYSISREHEPKNWNTKIFWTSNEKRPFSGSKHEWLLHMHWEHGLCIPPCTFGYILYLNNILPQATELLKNHNLLTFYSYSLYIKAK